jgi:hypothetical protein
MPLPQTLQNFKNKMTKMTMTQNDHFWGKISPQLGNNFSLVGEKIFSNECPLKNAFCSTLIFSKLSLQIKLFSILPHFSAVSEWQNLVRAEKCSTFVVRFRIKD